MQPIEENIDLGPLYEPTPVAFHFETSGWYVFFGIALGILLWFILKFILKYRRNAYRRQALKLLGTVEERFKSNQEAACVNDTMVLLKQVALTTYGRAEVAELNGEVWLEFLDSKSKNTSFTSLADIVLSALYRNKLENPETANHVFTDARNWITHHA